MSRFMTLLFSGCVLLLIGAAGSAQEKGGALFRDMFCPEDTRFVGDEWSMDGEGRCMQCRRKPVAVEAALLKWSWCRDAQSWLDAPCANDATRRCCTPYSATALVWMGDLGTVRASLYCPSCKQFRSEVSTDDTYPACLSCGRFMTATDVLTRTWYWCAGDEAWLDEPCTMDRTGKCCAPRTVRVPAVSLRIRPYLRSISYRPAGVREGSGLLVSTHWLASHLDDPDVVVLHAGFNPRGRDVADRMTFRQGHIPFAQPVTWKELAVTRDGLPNEFPPLEEMVAWVRRSGIDWNSRIVVYDTGTGLEAARAFVALDYMGLGGQTALLDGMWHAWLQGMNEVSSARAAVEETGFVPELRPDVLASLREMRDLVWLACGQAKKAVILDARDRPAFTGLSPGKDIKRPGHVPGALHLPWSKMIRAEGVPAFRAEEDLRGMFESVGARPGSRLVIYCRTGVKASHLYFTAKTLGYRVSLYDGSYFEWSNRTDYPVVFVWSSP